MNRSIRARLWDGIGNNMKIDFEGERFVLRVDDDGKPYILKRLKWNEARSRQYYGIVWASWHKSPVPARAVDRRALASVGWTWDRSPPHPRWIYEHARRAVPVS